MRGYDIRSHTLNIPNERVLIRVLPKNEYTLVLLQQDDRNHLVDTTTNQPSEPERSELQPNGLYKPGREGLAHMIDAFFYSLNGLRSAWRHEIAFRIHCRLCAALVPIACLLAKTAIELALLLMTCGLVLMAETFNSSIESIVDRVSTDHHYLSGRAKDLGSAGVFISLMTFLCVWVPIIFTRFFL